MSSIPQAVSAAISVQQQTVAADIGVAVAQKQIEVQQQAGDSINQILEASVEASRQIADGRLDVRV